MCSSTTSIIWFERFGVYNNNRFRFVTMFNILKNYGRVKTTYKHYLALFGRYTWYLILFFEIAHALQIFSSFLMQIHAKSYLDFSIDNGLSISHQNQ